ncbi:MAG: hypothetical protein HYY52_05935 [Candidatus Melainabacteria bacterium]|nr:hypothetical protein [Candidatus Melainabacteria bacterium]
MREKKIQNTYSWRFIDRDDPVEFVKMLCDSYNPSEDIKGYGTPEEGNIDAVKGHYGSTQDPKLKKKLANAIVQLMRDEDYRVIAISAASELYLEEALPEFKFLSTLSLKELRKIKTVNCTNALFCTLNYSSKFYDSFSSFYKQFLEDSSNSFELANLLRLISDKDPDFILSDLEKYIKMSFNADETEQNKTSGIHFVLSGIFKKYGDGYCIDLAKRFKENLPKEYQILFYKALEQNPTPRFKPYLEDLKTILEIPD